MNFDFLNFDEMLIINENLCCDLIYCQCYKVSYVAVNAFLDKSKPGPNCICNANIIVSVPKYYKIVQHSK